MAASRYRSAEAYYFMREYGKTIEYGKAALQLFKDAGILRRQDQSAHVISAAYKELGDYKKALEYFELKVKLTDSLSQMTEARKAEFADRKFTYELTQKRDSSMFAQERIVNALQIENMNNILSKERMRRYMLFGGVAVILIVLVILWIGFQRKRRDNIIIEEQKQMVEEKNKEIVDSINYAKRIQSAILPPDHIFKELLPQSFVLYLPKDIVAGDFYWLESFVKTSDSEETSAKASDSEGKNINETIFFAAADCTGHGVPGAMVSVICNNGLNRSVREHNITEPGEILDMTRKIVIQEFEKSVDDVNDGMDIALCSLSDKTLKFAGAHNPVWIIRNGELMETKGDKQPC